MQKTMTENYHIDNRHHAHRHNRDRPTTSIVPSCIHDLERRNQFAINAHSSVPAGTSRFPLIHLSTKTSKVSPINT